jgi:hypothetical protein
MKTYLLIALMFASSTAMFAGSGKGEKETKGTCVLSGKVLDGSNAEALPGATVTIEELGISTMADLDGLFSFQDLPEGDYTVKIEYVSYLENKAEKVTVSSSTKLKKFFLSSL